MPILFVLDSVPGPASRALEALRQDGSSFEPYIVRSFAEARQKVEHDLWTAVVSDFRIGGETVHETLRLTRAKDADLPFVVVARAGDAEHAAEVIRMGATDFTLEAVIARLPASLHRAIATAALRREHSELHSRLRVAEERYRRTFERAPIGIANVDAGGHFLAVNQRFCELLGYDEVEILGRTFAEFGHPDDNENALARFARVVAGEVDAARYERRYFRKDGRIAWANVSLAAVRDEGGALEYVIGLIEDVTPQRESHETLLRQAHLLDAVGQAVIATDLAGTVTYWNAFAEKLYGWSRHEAHGRSIVDLVISPESPFRGAAILEQLKRDGSWSGEIDLVRRDGTHFPALVTNSRLLDENGRCIGLVSTSFDLTEEKRAERELRESRMQLAEAQEVGRIGSWSYDFRTRERHWSEALCRMLGFPAGIQPTIEDVFARIHPDDVVRVRQAQARAHAALEPGNLELRVLAPSGTITMSIRYSFTRDANGSPLKGTGVAIDITEARRAEEELRRRGIQQAAVANLGQIALSGASVSFLLEQVVETIRTVLHLETAAVLQLQDGAFVVVAGEATLPFDEGEGGVSVPIRAGAGHLWGQLGGRSASATAFAANDVDFLRSVATVISQAIERRDAEETLARRARQQSAIARFGRQVLSFVDPNGFATACDLIALGTDADFSFFTEVTQENTLRLRAGRTWADDGEIPSLVTMQAGAALMMAEPAVVYDFRSDERYGGCEDAASTGILSGVVVPVASGERLFGVFGAYSQSANQIREEEVHFIEALANILAEALEREIVRGAVEESEHRYRRIFEGSTEVIYSVDEDGRFTSINPTFETITGWKREEWLGRPFAHIVAAEDRERVNGVFAEIFRDRRTAVDEITLEGRSGRVVVEVTSFPKVEDGRVVEVYGFARDITEVRRAAADRERVARSLELMLQSTVEGIFTLDIDGRCTMINRAAAAFLGMPPDEVLGKPVHDLLHQTEGAERPLDQCLIHSVLRTGQARTVAGDTFRRSDGVLIPVDYSAAPIFDEGVLVGAVVTFTDLTERKKLETKLEQVTRLSSLGRLAATVAHEFNNVLMGILPFVDVIRRSQSRQKVESALEHITNAIKRGQRITGDILRFTQPAEPVRSRIDLHGWLEALAVETRSVLDRRWTVTVSAEPLSIDADPGQLHQVLLNLILNARDAMPSGGAIRITARKTRDVPGASVPEDLPGYVHISVSDTGTGMTSETLGHVFEPLFTTKKNGTGLGLAVAHQVVQRHRGEIVAESEPGAGATFHIYLPLSRADQPVPAGVGRAPADETASRHILLVEDDPIVAAGLSELLEFEGFSVTAVDTGAAAIRAIADGAFPDAVILDVGLPDMDGTAVFHQIAQISPALPVIFSTGHADRARLEDLLTRGNVGYLLKPYESGALLEALSEVTARR